MSGPRRERVEGLREKDQWEELEDSELDDEELTLYRFGVG